jgi:FlaA1/EpsC-like NDP-sugar epimerase
MISATELPHQADTVQQKPLAKKNNSTIWKVIFIILFIFDTIVGLLFYGYGGIWRIANLDSLVAYVRWISFWLLPIVNLLLFLETFQKKLLRTFTIKAWVVICFLLLISNVGYVSWVSYLHLLDYLNPYTSYKSMTVLGTAPPAAALVLTDFIAGFFYIIQERPQVKARNLLISFLAIIILVDITFGISGFLF